MKSDIEIAQEAELVHIKEVAEKLGITCFNSSHFSAA